jgi:SAM-dependent methyltransferase
VSDARFDAFNEWEQAAWDVDTRAAAYARGIQQMTSGSVGPLLDAVGATAGSRLLDVGCGPGPVAAAAVARGAVVTGVDVSEAMLSLARARVPEADFRLGSAEALPVDAAAFDAVCGNFVLPHVGHPVAAVREALRALHPGGRLAFTDWDPERAGPLAVFWELLATSGMPMPPGAPPAPDVELGDPEQMRTVLEAGGAGDVDVSAIEWMFTVAPSAWWDATIAGTPRTGARIAAAPPEAQRDLRARYDEAIAAHPHDGDRVVFPVVAVLGTGTKRG